MTSFIQFMGITTTLTIIVIGISYGIVRCLMEFAPQWLTESGKLPPIPITTKKTRIIPLRRKQITTLHHPYIQKVKLCEGEGLKRALRYSQPQELVHP